MESTLLLQFDPDMALLARLDEEIFHDPTWGEEAYRTLWHAHGLVANERGVLAFAGENPPPIRPVGFLLYRTLVDEVEILRLGVLADCRRQGVARQLLAAAVAGWAAQGLARVFLEVRPSNPQAQALYHQAGFTQVGLRPKYYHDTGEDALVLARDLI